MCNTSFINNDPRRGGGNNLEISCLGGKKEHRLYVKHCVILEFDYIIELAVS